VTSRLENGKLLTFFTVYSLREIWLGNPNRENIVYTVVILLYYFYGPGDTEKTVLAGCTPPWVGFGGRTVEACPPNPRVSPPPPPPQLDCGSCLVRRPLCYERFPEINGSSIYMHEYGSGPDSRLNILYVYGSRWHYADFSSCLRTRISNSLLSVVRWQLSLFHVGTCVDRASKCAFRVAEGFLHSSI